MPHCTFVIFRIRVRRVGRGRVLRHVGFSVDVFKFLGVAGPELSLASIGLVQCSIVVDVKSEETESQRVFISVV